MMEAGTQVGCAEHVIGRWATSRVAWGAFATAVLAHALTFVIWPKAAPVGVDLNVYRAASEVILAGRPLYEGPITYQMEFVYPPFPALLFVPLGLFPIIPLAAVMTLAHLFAIIPAVWLSWRVLGYRPNRALYLAAVLMAAPMLWLESVWLTVALGQVNLVLLMLVLLDVGRLQNSRWHGVGVGLAAGIKLTPLIFVVYLLVTKRFRAAMTAVATLAGTIALGFLVLPRDSLRYWGGVFLSTNRMGALDTASNQSISGMLGRFTGDQNFMTPLWLVLALAAGLLGMGLAARAYRHGEELLGVAFVGMTGTVVSPFSWGNHWVWFVPLLVYLVHIVLTEGDRLTWWVTGVVYALTFAWIVSFPSVGGFTQPLRVEVLRQLAEPKVGLFFLDSWPWLEALTRNTYLLVFALTAAYVVARIRPRQKFALT